MPAGRALPAMLVPIELIASAMALRSIAFQGAVVAGPALGGLIFTFSPVAVYGTAAVLLAVGLVCALVLNEPPIDVGDEPEHLGLRSVLGGIRFIRHSPMILGAISLDLFAVLFGGAIALAAGVRALDPPHRADRAGPSAQRTSHRCDRGRALVHAPTDPAQRRIHAAHRRRRVRGEHGRLRALALASPLSMAALAVSGFVDMISMNIRGAAVAIGTPDALRGRVLAVEMVFISASNELGAFESGLAAKLFGAVTSVVAGGAVTIGLAAGWLRFFPALARIDRLEDVRPAPLGADAST